MAQRADDPEDEWEDRAASDRAEGPGEHDRHLMDDADGDEDTAACPECGASVWAEAERCRRCGAYFAGDAWHGRTAGRRRPTPPFVEAVGVLMVLVILLVWVIAGL